MSNTSGQITCHQQDDSYVGSCLYSDADASASESLRARGLWSRLQAERADESGHEDNRQERGRSDDVRVARNDRHACEPKQEASRHSSACICAFYTAPGKVFHGLSVTSEAPKVDNPEHRRRGKHGRLVERDRPRRSLVPGAVRPDEPARYCPPTPAVRGSGVLRAVDAGAGRQAPDRARGAAAGRRKPAALALDTRRRRDQAAREDRRSRRAFPGRRSAGTSGARRTTASASAPTGLAAPSSASATTRSGQGRPGCLNSLSRGIAAMKIAIGGAISSHATAMPIPPK